MTIAMVITASPMFDSSAAANQTQVHTFPPSLSGTDFLPEQNPGGSIGLVINGAFSAQEFGWGLAAGDFNADGVDDLLAGFAPNSPNPGQPPGGAALIFGASDLSMGPDGIELLDAFQGTIDPEQIALALHPEQAGFRVRNLGDLDNDGIEDLGFNKRTPVVGGGFQDGQVFVVYGGPTVAQDFADYESLLPENGGDGTRGFVLTGSDAEFLGRDFFGGEDINGDGLDDFIVLSNREFDATRGMGMAWVIYGYGDRTWPAQIDQAALSTLPPERGFAIVPPVLEHIPASDDGFYDARFVDDLNQDGIGEIVLCRSISQYPGTDFNGSCFLLFGRAGSQPFPSVVDLGMLLTQNGGDGASGMVLTGANRAALGSNSLSKERGGFDVGNAGDFDGDGFPDLVINAPGVNVQSETYLIFGGQPFPAEIDFRDGFDAVAGQIRLTRFRSDQEAPSSLLHFGTAIQGIGDVNHDGFDDVAMTGEFGIDLENTGAWIVFGQPSPPQEFVADSLLADNGGDGRGGLFVRDFPDEEGLGVGLAHGDFNDDGIDDVAIGGPLSDPGGRSNAGRVVILYGRGGATGVPSLNSLGLLMLVALLGLLAVGALRRLNTL